MRTPSNTWEDSGREYGDDITEAGTGDRPASDSYSLVVTPDMSGHRLDYAVSRELGISRAYAQNLIKSGLVKHTGDRRVKPSIKVEDGEIYDIALPPPEKLDLEPEEVPFGVVYSDDDIIVVDKPAGVVVHPAPGHFHGTLVHGLLYRFPGFGNMNGVMRPGIVHRLDATTSGLMVVARNGRAMEKLYVEFKSRRVEKTYLFLCHGTPKDARARIDLPIGRDAGGKKMTVREDGRASVTDYEIIWSNSEYSFGRCVIHTGRTHQIRVHMKAIGCPLVGDSLYASSRNNPFTGNRVFLHSWRLAFTHPTSGKRVSYSSFIPGDLANLLTRLRRPLATTLNQRGSF
ncbi:MAG: RluA family pseudouridine synthase [Synergistaceae bacterium]|nr:RluA family pseudouridine synthase [Synergistaceae bacterium]